ncbi:MAG: M56 family metallopeptidase, partial [Planctomycetota bacterium]
MLDAIAAAAVPLAVSNLIGSALLALAAALFQRGLRCPRIARCMWVFALLKAMSPAAIGIAVWTSGGTAVPSALPDTGFVENAVPAVPIADGALFESGSPAVVQTRPQPIVWSQSACVLAVGMMGSVVVLLATSTRIWRFRRLLRQVATPAPVEVQELATQTAERIGLRRLPALRVVPCRISPLIWWIVGRPQLVLPAALLQGEEDALRYALAHELMHLRRRDHWVRGLEQLASVLCWWNPVVAIARRGLRSSEELCCDRDVLTAFKTAPADYAAALLKVAELLAPPALRPPALASPLTAGGSLKRRVEMILSSDRAAPASRLRRRLSLLAAAAILPVGVSAATDPPQEPGQPAAEIVEPPAAVEENAAEHAAASKQDEATEANRDVTTTVADCGPPADDGGAADRETLILRQLTEGLISVETARTELAKLRREAELRRWNAAQPPAILRGSSSWPAGGRTFGPLLLNDGGQNATEKTAVELSELRRRVADLRARTIDGYRARGIHDYYVRLL